jgi:hypothetical protein
MHEDGAILRFLVQSPDDSTPVEIMVMHERASQA